MDINHVNKIKQTAKVLFNSTDITQALDKIANQINKEHATSNLLVLCVVNGGIATLGHLINRIDAPLQIDYIHATRYQGATHGKTIKWLATPQTEINNRNILIVDDILDGGITLSAIIKYCEDLGAKSVNTAVLLDKKNSRDPAGTPKATYTGLYLESNEFVFGFGMDYNNYLRNTNCIYAANPEIINQPA